MPVGLASRSARRGCLAAFAVALALAAAGSRADDPDELMRLRQEAAQMRRSLDQLDARIRALENADRKPDDRRGTDAAKPASAEAAPARPAPDYAATTPAGAPSASSPYLLRRNWSEIQPGISQDRVDALLGKPERVLRIDGNVVWYYVYPELGRGSVFFDGRGKVSSAQSPRPGWSW